MPLSPRTLARSRHARAPVRRGATSRFGRVLLPGVLTFVGMLVLGGVAWWAGPGDWSGSNAAGRHADGLTHAVVPDTASPLADADAPAGGAQPPTVHDRDPHADKPVDASGPDRARSDARVHPVPWLSLIPPAGDGWVFEVVAEAGLPAFVGAQPPDGHLEVFVHDHYANLEEAVREVELAAERFGASEIGRDQQPVPGADDAVALVHAVPDASDPFDQGILLLEVAGDTRALVVVLVMFGPDSSVSDIEQTFASVVLDASALRQATAGRARPVGP